MLSKNIIAAMSLSILLSGQARAQEDLRVPVFTDVSETTPYSVAIENLQKKGIVGGYSDGSFRPMKTINRAEFAKIITGMSAAKVDIQNCGSPFSDVPTDAWYTSFVCIGKARGLLMGNPDGTFRPNDPVNFVEAAKVIALAMRLEVNQSDTQYKGFNGEQLQAWFKPYVVALEQKHAIPETIVYFRSALKRGEMVEMIDRLQAQRMPDTALTFEAIKWHGFEYYIEPPDPFDGCGTLVKYSSEPWFSNVRQNLSQIAEGLEIDEMCVSSSAVIVLSSSSAEGGSHVFRYFISEDSFREATRIDDSTLTFSVKEFGKRSGTQVPLVKNGCVVGNYDVMDNTINVLANGCAKSNGFVF